MPDYDIYIESNELLNLQKYVKELYHEKKIYVVTDENVNQLYHQKLIHALPFFEVIFVVIKPGEHSKSIETYQKVISELIQKQMKRNHLLIALGGGVVGDLTGFVASTLYRGVKFIQIPTTLLAQVDSSIGGKVGIDLEQGKNLLGSFYRPLLVYIDPAFLETLSKREYANGLAEMIKAGLIGDKKLYHHLKSNEKVGVDEIVMAIQVKRALVLIDPYDHKERMYLNFGHTFGHAIEKKHHYDTYKHGEAISYGMLMALEIGMKRHETHFELYQEVKSLLLERGLVKEPLLKIFDYKDEIVHDKKYLSEGLHFVIVPKVGEVKSIILEDSDLL
ncbi:MAG: 3-dehydroquinate synthase [Acholeplasmataceae bacterium]|nr:3-dehydroquinate synthase [Acholeplasmataceae bacterium]